MPSKKAKKQRRIVCDVCGKDDFKSEAALLLHKDRKRDAAHVAAREDQGADVIDQGDAPADVETTTTSRRGDDVLLDDTGADAPVPDAIEDALGNPDDPAPGTVFTAENKAPEAPPEGVSVPLDPEGLAEALVAPDGAVQRMSDAELQEAVDVTVDVGVDVFAGILNERCDLWGVTGITDRQVTVLKTAWRPVARKYAPHLKDSPEVLAVVATAVVVAPPVLAMRAEKKRRLESGAALPPGVEP